MRGAFLSSALPNTDEFPVPIVDVTVVAEQRPFARLIAVAPIFAESTAASLGQWRLPKARRTDDGGAGPKGNGELGESGGVNWP